MATFSDDFSGQTVSTVADASHTTAITNWTLSANSGSDSFQTVTIVTDGTAIGGKVARWNDTGWGEGMLFYPTAIGNISANTATDVLISFKVGAWSTDKGGYFHTCGPIARALLDFTKFYGVGLNRTTGTASAQGWYFQSANDWANLGSAKSLTGFTSGVWYWARMTVNSSGDWSWKVWAASGSEPGSPDGTGSDTSQTSGYVGFGGIDDTPYGPIDIQWFSVGTGADSAPSPPGTPQNVTGSGVLTAAPATASGTAVRGIHGSGALTITAITLSGSGSVNGAVNHVTGSGGATAPIPTTSGSGLRGVKDNGGAIDIAIASIALVAGTGTVTPAGGGGASITGTGALVITMATVSGSGVRRVISQSAAITSSLATITGSGVRHVLSQGASALQAPKATVRGLGPNVGLPDQGYRKMRIYVVSASGRVRWVSYIPVKQFPLTTAAKANRFDNDGALAVTLLVSNTGLREWVDYIPVVEVSDPDTGKWRYDNAGFLPVVAVI